MKLGSLFDGAGTFPFAGSVFGIKPEWASEIEEFPVQVTKKRLPQMNHLGDIKVINGAEVTPVDVISFGSPCQDLSVAGRRAGLDGDRSGLFNEAIRIIKEMRGKTNGKYPRYAVWENVPGAFSSNRGDDFRVVLQEFCKVKDDSAVIPKPTQGGGRWRTAGLIVGDGYSVAWRVLDAQFWGVPQRRRRIFVVADFGGESAGQILFEREGLSRHFAEISRSWKGVTRDTAFDTHRAGSSDGRGVGGDGDQTPTVIHLNNHPMDSRVTIGDPNTIETLTSRMGTGGGNVPLLLVNTPVVAFNVLQDAVPNKDVAPCLSTGNPKTGQANLGVCYAIDRAAFNQGKNAKYQIQIDENGVAHTLTAKGAGAVCYQSQRQWIVRRLTPIECARLQGMPDWWCKDINHSDAAEYKMWGNGMALPCTLYVMQGIAEQLKKTIREVI